MFFSYIERRMEIFFFLKYSTFSQKIATASLQKASKNIVNQNGIPGVYADGRWNLCYSLCYKINKIVRAL